MKYDKDIRKVKTMTLGTNDRILLNMAINHEQEKYNDANKMASLEGQITQNILWRYRL